MKMGSMKMKTVCCLFMFVWFAVVAHGHGNLIDIVVKHGAKPGGDATAALAAAWTEACACTVPTTILVPKGTFQLGYTQLAGPCKNPITLRVDAIIKAPVDPAQIKSREWFCIRNMDHFTLTGCGTFDGQGGKKAWAQNNYAKSHHFPHLPNNLNFAFLTNSLVEGITTLDSKLFHITVFGCKDLTFQRIKIIAPDQSPNTDGIHVARSAGIKILDSDIGTGDDCISVGDGTSQLHIEKVRCGPGHGISVGSLGKYPKEEPVCGMLVKNCTLIGSDNGVRIKSWANLEPGSVTDVTFEDIIMTNVANPILIDQTYCPNKGGGCNIDSPSKVPISKVSYRNIRGTSRTKETIKLMCSKLHPCAGIEISNVNLVYTGPDGPATSVCANVKPAIVGKVIPAPCTAAAASVKPGKAAAKHDSEL